MNIAVQNRPRRHIRDSGGRGRNGKHRHALGGLPGEGLPDLSGFASPKRIGRREGGDRPLRINHSKVPAKHFRRIETMDAMLETLFGALPSGPVPVVDETIEIPA